MRFIVTSTALLKNLQQISGVISTNTVLSVLEDFLFELKGNTLTLTATDLETMMRVQMDVNDAQGEGRICIPSKILTEYLKNLPEQPITFNVNDKDSVLNVISKWLVELGEIGATFSRSDTEAIRLMPPMKVMASSTARTIPVCCGLNSKAFCSEWVTVYDCRPMKAKP